MSPGTIKIPGAAAPAPRKGKRSYQKVREDTMDIQGLITLTDAKLLTEKTDLAREVKCGYSCDLLSWVMAHGKSGMAWITVQTHMNVVAVATLMEMAAVIVPEGIQVGEDVINGPSKDLLHNEEVQKAYLGI
jgi:hypothetical protein